MKTIRYAVCILAIIFLPITVHARDSYPPLPEALDALQSDNEVTVTVGRFPLPLDNPVYYAFEPTRTAPEKGFVIYPGGKVDARSYAPTARSIARAGYLTVIAGMPDDLAMGGWARAHTIIMRYNNINTWAVGGHSMGGSFACKFAQRFTWEVDGVILWASWPSFLFNLRHKPLKAISIYGSEDGYPDEIEAGARQLPPDTEFVRIEGGNHTQFGYYDTSPEPYQEHDNPALISREEQQRQIIEATVGFLSGL
ncbi:MAG: alpha/beta hydrolase [Desulfobacterota bacterium]|nr:alpha/beta hydrolase [Thermodesulfobacteriota bacterium]